MDFEKGDQTVVENENSAPENAELSPKEGHVEPPKEAEAPYSPNFKFKVLDEEKEFDEFIRGAVKKKEDEDKLRDLYTKAYGLEANKKTLDGYKDKVEKHYRPLEDKHTQMMANIAYLDQAVQKKDFQTFFDTLKIPKQDILKYALDLVKYEELPQDQKALIEEKKQAERYNEMLAHQNQTSQEQVQQYAVQVRTMQLSNELMKQDVNSFVQNFDARAGKPGAFREHVIRHANLAYYQNQVDLPVEQAVKEVMALYGNLVAPQSLPSQTPSPGASQRPPVIPNVQSSGSSPAKSMPTSIADLKRLAKQKANE